MSLVEVTSTNFMEIWTIMNVRRITLASIKQIKLYLYAQMLHLEGLISSMLNGLFNMIFPVR